MQCSSEILYVLLWTLAPTFVNIGRLDLTLVGRFCCLGMATCIAAHVVCREARLHYLILSVGISISSNACIICLLFVQVHQLEVQPDAFLSAIRWIRILAHMFTLCLSVMRMFEDQQAVPMSMTRCLLELRAL